MDLVDLMGLSWALEVPADLAFVLAGLVGLAEGLMDPA